MNQSIFKVIVLSSPVFHEGYIYDFDFVFQHLFDPTQEVMVRFAGFGAEEDEWVNVRKHVRQRSLPCESSECVAVLPGDLILCFQVCLYSSEQWKVLLNV